jgi:hypothetical protein
METFSRAEIQKFEDWMAAHLAQFFPAQSHALGEPQLRELIQHGIRRATEHGITKERDVCKFIDLMIVFGRDFDQNEKQTWAGATGVRMTPSSKIRSLYKAADMRLRRRGRRLVRDLG